MEWFAWLSLSRCFNVRARFSCCVSTWWISTELRSIAVPGLPPKKRGTPKGLEKEEKDENMVGLIKVWSILAVFLRGYRWTGELKQMKGLDR